MERLHAFIFGRVQMVGFRYNTRKKAQELGINGWVKNLEDGRVEVEGEGTNEQIDLFLQWLHHGPRLANVSNVDYRKEESANPKYKNFTINH